MTSAASINSSLITLLESALSSEYFKQPIPSKTDHDLGRLLSNFFYENPVERDFSDLKQISNGIDGDMAGILSLFAERMASFAVRENSVIPIKQGLIALSVCVRTRDSREALLVLSLLHDAMLRISMEPKRVFNDTSHRFENSEFLSDFLDRSDRDKSIAAMGYKASETEEGFLYSRTW